MIVCASYLLEDSLTANSILSSYDLQTEKLLTFIDSSDVISFVIAGKEYLANNQAGSIITAGEDTSIKIRNARTLELIQEFPS